MIPTVTGPNGENPVIGGVTLTGAVTYILPWCATARDLADPSDLPASNERESKTVYMRGLKERVFINTNNSTSWQWRRVCFTVKGFFLNIGTNIDSLETSNGWVRLISQHNNDTFGNLVIAQLFRGVIGKDYVNYFNAPTNTENVTIMYDKTVMINSGVEGVCRNYHLWHPMNKNLVYNDNENGRKDASGIHSTEGKPGMGDYYVVDFIAANFTSSVDDKMLFIPEATLYWHEK